MDVGGLQYVRLIDKSDQTRFISSKAELVFADSVRSPAEWLDVDPMLFFRFEKTNT